MKNKYVIFLCGDYPENHITPEIGSDPNYVFLNDPKYEQVRLFDEDGKRIGKNGNEFGSTTGRPRRCGWLDLPALRYSIMLNGVTHLYMMKADVLSDFDTVKICVGYIYNGKEIDYFPSSVDSEDIKPVYKTFDGWTSKTNNSRNFSDLEDNFKNYIKFIEDNVAVNINLISLGPDRDKTVLVN